MPKLKIKAFRYRDRCADGQTDPYYGKAVNIYF